MAASGVDGGVDDSSTVTPFKLKLVWLVVGNAYIYNNNLELKFSFRGQEFWQAAMARDEFGISVLNITELEPGGHPSTYDGKHYHEEVNRRISSKLLSMLDDG